MLRKFTILFVSVVSLAVWACTDLSSPEMPSWDITLEKIPLLGPDTVSLGDELTDDAIFTDANNLFHIQFSGDQQIDVADQMKQEAINPVNFGGAIGNFTVTGNPGQSVNFNIFEAFPGLVALDGQSAPVPPSTLPVINKDIAMDNFSQVTFISGAITLTITNDLPWDLGSPISVQLFDVTNGVTVTTAAFASEILKNGGTATKDLDLAGKTLSNNLRVIITGNENGQIAPVTLNGATQGFSVDVSMNNLVASSATAKVPQQSFNITDAVNISSDSMKVISAEVASGQIILDFVSGFDFDVQMDLTLAQILDGSGNPFNTIITIPANNSAQTFIDMAGRTLALGGGSLDFDITVDVLTDPIGSTTLTAADQIQTTVSTTELQFASVTADLNIGTDFPSFEQEVVDFDFDIPLTFSDIQLKLNFANNPADMNINLVLTGTKNGTILSANYVFSLIGGLDTNKVILTNTGVTVNGVASETGSGIADVINMLPSNIAFSGSAVIDDRNATLTTAPIDIAYSVSIPFVFSLSEGAILDGDPDTLDIGDDTRDKIRNNMRESSIELVISNGLPLGGTLNLRTADAATLLAGTAENQWPLLSTFTLAAREVDGTGAVVQQTVKMELTKDQIAQLAKAEVMYWSVTLQAVTNAELKSTDKFILHSGYITGSMMINSTLWDDKKNSGGGSP